nr:hypothetical protein [Tanacetum cinerariifolium]
AQVVDLSSHSTCYISPALTQKVFANMRSVGKGFSGVETPLFKNMLEVREVDAEEEVQVPAQDDVDQENVTKEIADDVAQPTSPLPPSPVIPSSPPHQSPRPPPPQAAECLSLLVHQVLDKCSTLVLRVKGLETANTVQQLEILKLKARLEVDQEKDPEIEGRQADTQAEIYNIDLDHSSNVLSMQEDDAEVQEAVEIITTVKLMTEVVTAATEPAVVDVSTPISVAKPAAKPKVLKIVPAAPVVSTRKRNGVIIRDPEEELHDDTLAETLSVIDKGKGILVENLKPMKKKDQIEMDAEEKHMISPIFQARFDANMRFLLKSREEMEKEEEEIIKSINETPAQKAAKRRRLLDEDDDVFVEATPIGTKVEEENEMSLELLRFTRQQLLDYQQG